MKYRIIIFMVVCTALLLTGCGNKEPLAPDSTDLALNEKDASLAKRPNIEITPYEAEEKNGVIIVPGDDWISEDNVLHVRGRVMVWVVESDEYRIAGTNKITQNYHLNLTTGNGSYTVTCYHEPSAVDGRWEGRLIGGFKNFVFSGEGAAIGYGELDGYIQVVTLHDTPHPYDPVKESGYIIKKN
jgi:predicted small lipoprotein YifL